ncbi:MAG: hypothetical protein R6U17_06190 [Thermoplasmata archaeon]
MINVIEEKKALNVGYSGGDTSQFSMRLYDEFREQKESCSIIENFEVLKYVETFMYPLSGGSIG